MSLWGGRLLACFLFLSRSLGPSVCFSLFPTLPIFPKGLPLLSSTISNPSHSSGFFPPFAFPLSLLHWPQGRIHRTVAVGSGRLTQTGLHQQKSDTFDSHSRNVSLASGTAVLRDRTNVNRTQYVLSFSPAVLWLLSSQTLGTRPRSLTTNFVQGFWTHGLTSV